ncbi:hypothetical protein RF11_01820 [Thelohanellus kitauei]|uniref:Uncharacterized protein n=1 Tax=Thelohanellus kitauei TaxID=669202 RepID=A0A0C2IXI9_THEKT|nr:hypothetical protein RF11_01820 [Thelohanellus kitauei]
MEAFERFFSSRMHEYIFIMENGPDHAAREWQPGNIPSTLHAFPPPGLSLGIEMEEHCKNSLSEIRSRPVNLIEDGSREIIPFDCDGYYRNMLKYVTRCNL